MSMWFFLKDGEYTDGMLLSQAILFARSYPESLAWTEGMEDWVPAGTVRELHPAFHTLDYTAEPPLESSIADVIDYRIYGNDIQYVEVELDPGETAIAEAGAMMYKSGAVTMRTVLGDGSDNNFLKRLTDAGIRVLTGESFFITAFTHEGSGKGHVAFAAPYAGRIVPVLLSEMDGNAVICQKDCFLAAARGVSISLYLQEKVMTAMFGGEGFIMQKLVGDGMVFMHAGGSIATRELAAGEVIHVNTGSVVGFAPTVSFDIQFVGGIKSALFGGQGVFFSRMVGPGRIWLQSMPFVRLAGRMLAAAPQLQGKKI